MSKTQIFLKTKNEIELIQKSGDVLGKVHGELSKRIQPGITTLELDTFAEEFIKDHGGSPSFKGYKGFPYALCISVNETVVHGFPSQYVLKEGDLISIDCGVYLNGFHSDSAYTYAVGSISDEKRRFLEVTKTALEKGIEQFKIGNRIGDVSHRIQSYVEQNGYSVVRELVGHGVGKYLHELPEVPNYGKQGMGPKITEGMVIAIEPMVNMGKKNVRQEKDGWTIKTLDKSPSAHFEHTVGILNGQAKILTTFKYIEENVVA